MIYNKLQNIFKFLRTKWGIFIVATILIIGGIYWYTVVRSTGEVSFVTVTSGPISETVSVTGNTNPIQSVSLGFQNAGTIAQVYRNIGDRVNAGDVIARLNTASLSAALQQAEAAYDSAVASRSATSLPEVAAVARNVYSAAFTTLNTTLNDEVDVFFGQPTAYGPELLISDRIYSFGEMSRARESLDDKMQAFRKTLSDVQTSDPEKLLADATKLTQEVSVFLNQLATVANDRNSQVTSAQVSALATARSSVDTLLAKLLTAKDAYRTNSIGATLLADASVEQAAAGVAVAKANLQGTAIVAPISGVITQQDAKVGQIASPGAVIVSIISANAYEVDASIPETDIGKISIGNTVTMTLDAFPSETFTGTVFYIDPAQTVTQGVVDYKIKVAFTKSDSRLKSGLTANLGIQTARKEAVLKLPQYAILQNDNGTFVQVRDENGVVVDKPITLGIQDEDGNVEILSGVSDGQEVLNVGLKK